MAIFDNIVNTSDNFKGYKGNPPTNEEEYNALDCWIDSSVAPTWIDIKSSIEVETIRQNRKAEYPTIQECIHAILDDDLDALQVLRQAVKDKYPKE